MDLRCSSKKHAVLNTDTIEVKCDSKFCGAGRGVVVLHTFDKATGVCLDTRRFRDPERKIS